MKPLAVYEWQTKKRIAYLENAYNISYTLRTNAVWSASFTLPYSDNKQDYCRPFNLVEIWDVDAGGADKYIGLFQIIFSSKTLSQGKNDIEYTLEHVFSTLLNSSIIGRVEIGGSNTSNTKAVLEYILSKQYSTTWKLGICEYAKESMYEFEDVNLLNAILSVPARFTDDYCWVYDTALFPWTVGLKIVAGKKPIADIRYKKNMFGIVEKTDIRSMVNRLYLYGKKNDDGTKLNISSVNNGKHYLEAVDSIESYGITIMGVINEEQFETAQALYEYGKTILNKLKDPLVSYELDTQLVNGSANLKIGDCVRVITEERIDQDLVVQEIVRDDLTGTPNRGKITLGTGTTDFGVITKSFIN